MDLHSEAPILRLSPENGIRIRRDHMVPSTQTCNTEVAQYRGRSRNVLSALRILFVVHYIFLVGYLMRLCQSNHAADPITIFSIAPLLHQMLEL
jgi:hypothetical protein